MGDQSYPDSFTGGTMAYLAYTKLILSALLPLILAVISTFCAAEPVTPLSKEELIELEDVKTVASFLPFEKENPDTLKQQLLAKDFVLEEDNIDDSGVRLITFKKDHEHLNTGLAFIIVNNTINAYGVYFPVSESAALSTAIDKLWQENGGVKQQNGKVNVMTDDRINQEIEKIHELETFLPFEKQDAVVFKQQLIELGYKVVMEKTDSFGLTNVHLIKENYFSYIDFSFDIVNNKLGDYTLYLGSYLTKVVNHSNKSVSELMRETWAKNNLRDTPRAWSYAIHKKFNDAYEDYFQAVAMGNNIFKPVAISKELLTDYAYLISEQYESPENDCGSFDAGWYSINMEHASDAMFALDVGNRVDILENVLSGFNPIARIYAIKLAQKLKLDSNPDIKKKIDRLLELNAPIKTCKWTLTTRELKENGYEWTLEPGFFFGWL